MTAEGHRQSLLGPRFPPGFRGSGAEKGWHAHCWVEGLMSSAAALPLPSSVHPESTPLPRAILRARPIPLASLGLAGNARAGKTSDAPSSAGPSSDVVARLPRPVPLPPSVAALHAAGAPEPANAVHPEDAGHLDGDAPAGALETELIAMLPSLERRAYRWCRDNAEAQDLAQDTVVRALGKKPTFDSQSHLRAWLYTVLRNLFISRRRRDQSWQRASGELALSATRTPEPAAPFLTSSVERALASLPEVFASVVRLVDLEDHSYADAASTLGVPVGTVMSRLFRARQRLARDLPDFA
jgi:RNA polymerase sigma-70 factor (ECF subfamily)